MASDSKPPPPRRYRFRAGIPAELHDRGVDYPCDAHDLSRSGVLLVGAFPLPAGDRVDLTLKSPGGDLAARLRGRRVRLERDEENDAALQLGVEFVEVDEEVREILESLLARVISGQTPGPLERLRPDASPEEVRRTLEEIPPAHRISLASREARPRDREVFLQDKNPAVLDALSRNPHLLAAEARAVVSSPHTPPVALRRLATDPRFASDDEILMRIAIHPNTSIAARQELIDSLSPPVLRRLLARPALTASARQAILKKLHASH